MVSRTLDIFLTLFVIPCKNTRYGSMSSRLFDPVHNDISLQHDPHDPMHFPYNSEERRSDAFTGIKLSVIYIDVGAL